MLSKAAETGENQQPGRIERMLYVVENGGTGGACPKNTEIAATGNHSNPSKCGQFGSTCIKVHPDGMGALKKTECSPSERHRADGTPNFIWSPYLIEMG